MARTPLPSTVFGMPTLAAFKNLDQNIALCKQLGLGFIELNMCLPQFSSANLKKLALRKIAESQDVSFTVHLPEELDFGHDAASGYAEKSFLLSLQGKVLHSHLHDFGGKDHQELFTGSLDIAEALAYIHDAAIDVVIETKDPSSLESSIRRLKEKDLYH